MQTLDMPGRQFEASLGSNGKPGNAEILSNQAVAQWGCIVERDWPIKFGGKDVKESESFYVASSSTGKKATPM